MDSRLLAAFLAIAEERHFGRAAAKVRVSQPALSQQLRRLEAIVGVELVHRTSREVTLTPAGTRFEPEARAVVAASRRAVDAARRAAVAQSNPVRVGYNFVAARRYLPNALDTLSGATPTLVEMRSGAQLEALKRGDLDIALFYGPAPAHGWLRQRQLDPIDLGLIVGPCHPWWRRGSVDARELGGQPIILGTRQATPAMYDAVVAAAAAAGVALDVRHVIDDPLAATHLVANQPLACVASLDRAAALHDQASHLKAVRLTAPAVTLPLCVAWRAHDRHAVRDRFVAALQGGGQSRPRNGDRGAARGGPPDVRLPDNAASDTVDPWPSSSSMSW